MTYEDQNRSRFTDRLRRFPNAKTLREVILEIRIEKLNELHCELIREEGCSASEAMLECQKKLKQIPKITTSVPNKKQPARRGIRYPQELLDILDLPIMQCEVDRPNAPAGFIFLVNYRNKLRSYHVSHAICGKLNHLEERPALMDTPLEVKRSVRRTVQSKKVHHYTEQEKRERTDGSTLSRAQFDRSLHSKVNPNSNERARDKWTK